MSDCHDELPEHVLSVREAMNRVGLNLYPQTWNGKEYLDHWQLGLNPWPATKLRGVDAVRELLHLVWSKQVVVEAELPSGEFRELAPENVRHFHGGESMVADKSEIYQPCRLRFLPPPTETMTSKGGRRGYDYAPLVIRILCYLDEHGTNETADQITHTIRAELEKQGERVPSYSRLQPYVHHLLAYRVTRDQSFPDSIPETNSGASPPPEG